MNYDPNFCLCGNMSDQRVRLVFGQWEYRAEMIVTVGGNATGWSVIECAVRIAYDEILDKSRGILTMMDAEKNMLTCADDEGKCDDWLGNMLISAEIIEIQPITEEV